MYENIFLENCTEANYKISDGKEIYNCTKCKMDFDLVHNDTTKITECLYNDTKAYENSNQTNIVIPDSDTTDKPISDTTDKPDSGTTDKPDSGYDGNCGPGKEYNKAYGGCIEKMDKAPIITWKDIFGFKRSYTKIINGRTYKGPSVKLRGLTSDKISQHHSFIIILILEIF